MLDTIQNLLSELPPDTTISIQKFFFKSFEEADEFVKNISGEEPVHDSHNGVSWSTAEVGKIKVTAFLSETI